MIDVFCDMSIMFANSQMKKKYQYFSLLKDYDSIKSEYISNDKYLKRFRLDARHLPDKENRHPNLPNKHPNIPTMPSKQSNMSVKDNKHQNIPKTMPSPNKNGGLRKSKKQQRDSRKMHINIDKMKRVNTQKETIGFEEIRLNQGYDIASQFTSSNDRIIDCISGPGERARVLQGRCIQVLRMIQGKETIELAKCRRYYQALRHELNSMEDQTIAYIRQQLRQNQQQIKFIMQGLSQEMELSRHNMSPINQLNSPLIIHQDSLKGLSLQLLTVELPLDQQSAVLHLRQLSLLNPPSVQPCKESQVQLLDEQEDKPHFSQQSEQGNDLLCCQNLGESAVTEKVKAMQISFDIDSEFVHCSQQPILVDNMQSSPGVSPSFKPF